MKLVIVLRNCAIIMGTYHFKEFTSVRILFEFQNAMKQCKNARKQCNENAKNKIELAKNQCNGNAKQ